MNKLLNTNVVVELLLFSGKIQAGQTSRTLSPVIPIIANYLTNLSFNIDSKAIISKKGCNIYSRIEWICTTLKPFSFVAEEKIGSIDA